MENKDLILDLENGRDINVLLVAEEKYFMNLLALSNRYRNLNVKVIKKSDNYMNIAEEMDNIDIIIDYRDKKEDMANLGELQRLAFNSSSNDHRVTLGYSYVNTSNEGIDNVIITSFKEEIPVVKEFEMDNEYTPYDLLQITLNEHDGLDKKKVL